MMNDNDVRKAKDSKKAFKRLLNYLKSYKVSLILVIVFAVLSTVFSIVGPKVLGLATTKLFEGISLKFNGVVGAKIDFNYIAKILALLGGLYFISAVFQYIEYYIMSGVSGKISYNLRRSIEQKINKLPMAYYDKTNYGDTLSRVTNDVDTINNSLNNGLIQIISSTASLLGIMIMMFTISLKMTGIVLLVLPIALVIIMLITKYSQKYFTKNQEAIAKANDHIEESYGGHLVIKAFNRENDQVKKFNSINNELYNYGYKSLFFGGILFPITNFLGNICYVATAVLGGYFAVKGGISIGDVQAFLQYSRQFLQPIGGVARVVSVFQSTAAASERVFEFLDEDEDSVVLDPITFNNIKGHVEFKNVCFSYNKKDQIIKNFNLDILPGSKVAIVGPTGAGKTTIVNLLMRFYDIDKGEILVDGIDINKIDKADLRKIFGMVLQDTWLFNASIKENIKFGKLDATEDEIIKVCQEAQADHFINSLPDTYNFMLNEDSSNVAEGQKQLLTIARALIADPNILILDEATSNVDTRTEVLIQKAMNHLMNARTSFIIAHRLSTIREADLILVMNEGKIVETGNHLELMNQKGFYYELYNSQFETSVNS